MTSKEQAQPMNYTALKVYLAGLALIVAASFIGSYRAGATERSIEDGSPVTLSCVESLRDARDEQPNAANSVMDNCDGVPAADMLSVEQAVQAEDDFGALVYIGTVLVGAGVISQIGKDGWGSPRKVIPPVGQA